MSVRGCVVAVMLACTSLFAAGARADGDGMRCGTRLVSSGDSMLDVSERCGAPDASSQHVEVRVVRSWVDAPCFRENGMLRCGTFVEQAVQIVVDEWSYDFGPENLIRFLTFEEGRLERVRTGGYGSKQG